VRLVDASMRADPPRVRPGGFRDVVNAIACIVVPSNLIPHPESLPMSRRVILNFMRGLLCTVAIAEVGCSHASSPATTPAPAAPEGVTPEMVAAGNTIFNTKSCKNCHLPNGVGGVRGPDLTDDKWIHIDGSYDAIVRIVATGFTKAEQVDLKYEFSMNPRGGGNLSDADIRAVAAYVWSLSHGGSR
jgi:mono/diheme cytochrome c family protein